MKAVTFHKLERAIAAARSYAIFDGPAELDALLDQLDREGTPDQRSAVHDDILDDYARYAWFSAPYQAEFRLRLLHERRPMPPVTPGDHWGWCEHERIVAEIHERWPEDFVSHAGVAAGG